MEGWPSAKDIILSIEIKPGALCAALVQLKKKPPILACEYLPLAEGFPAVAESLRSLLRHAGKRLKSSVLILRREEIFLKHFLLPALAPEELRRELEERISQEIPYQANEVVKDYAVYEKKGEETKVTLVLGHRRVVDEKLKLLKEIPITPDQVLYSSEAIFHACREKNFRWAGPAGVLLLEVDQESSEIILVNENQLVSSKKVTIGKEAYEAGDPVAFSKLFHEIETLLQGEPGKVKKEVKRVVVSGTLPKGRHLEAKLKEFFWLDPNFLQAEGQESVDFSLTSLFGAAFASLSDSVNLQLDEIKKEKLRQEKFAAIHHFSQAASAFLAAILLFAGAHWASRQFVLSSLQEKIRALKPRISSIEETAVGLRQLAEHQKNKWLLLETLATLHRITPPQVVLRKIDYEREKGMSLRGVAKTSKQATDFFNQLRKISKTDGWVLDYLQQKKTNEEAGMFDFQIRFALKESPA